MRIAHLVFAGTLAASAALVTPALAKNSDAQKGEDKSVTSSSCSAYQQAPDGSWEQLPCTSPVHKAAIRASAEPPNSTGNPTVPAELSPTLPRCVCPLEKHDLVAL
jgi:hypothetical protein